VDVSKFANVDLFRWRLSYVLPGSCHGSFQTSHLVQVPVCPRLTQNNTPAQGHEISENLPEFSFYLTNRVITAAMIPMAVRFSHLSPGKRIRPMIDILLVGTTMLVLAVLLMVFPPPTATSSH
jgi:hypothetical protein